MGEIVDLPVITRLKVDPQRVVQKALDAGLDEVVIIGLDKDGGFYFSSSQPSAGDVLYHMEMAKKKLMEICGQ